MPTIRRVPEFYSTIQAAHNAANTGDVVLVAPGVYGDTSSRPNLVWTKQVHLIGDTTDPINNPVTIIGGEAVEINISSGSGILLFEGIRFHGGYGDRRAIGILGWPGTGLQLFMNRCAYDQFESADGDWIYARTSNPLKIRMDNCSELHDPAPSSGSPGYDISNYAANEVSVAKQKCYSTSMSWWSNPGSWAVYNVDSVVANTEGYGAQYGGWYKDQYITNPYRLAGIVDIENASPADVQIKLFLSSNGIMNNTASFIIAPDPTTGEWSFEYLPTDKTYYVALVPPEGYRPKLIGPYTPVQA